MNENEYWMFAIHQCEICDNATEHAWCVECGETTCIGCHENYGCPENK